jgi:hypothetical protein
MALNLTLRKSFLYIFATVGLIISIVGAVSLINLGLKTYVFKKADNYCYNFATPASVDKNGNSVGLTQQQKDEQAKQCQEQQTAQRQSQAAQAIAMLIVGAPLYLYNWMIIRKENQV